MPPDLKTVVSSLAIDPFDAAHVLAYGYYSYDSRDGGQTWHELPTTLVRQPSTRYNAESSVPWSPSKRGLYRGTSW